MTAGPPPAFDPTDAAQADAYLGRHGLASIDPLTAPGANKALIIKTSLSGARFLMQQSFTTRRAGGLPFRAFPLILGRPSANAFAVEHAGLQLCGIDVGLFTAAFEMSLFVFSQASLFKDVGDAEGECSPTLPRDSLLAFWISDRLRARGTPHGAPVGTELVPRGSERQHAAHDLTQLLLRFVWLHEFYHGLNGHTGLLAHNDLDIVLNEMAGGALGLAEKESSADAEAYRRLRHAMEYDADRSALWMLIRLQQIELETMLGLLAWPKPLRLRLAVFASALMTFLFDQSAKRQTQLSGATHPAPQHRLVDMVRTLASHLLEPPGEVKQAFHAALAEMNALQARLPQFVSGSRLVDDLHSKVLQQALDEVDDGVRSAREQFAPFAYRATA